MALKDGTRALEQCCAKCRFWEPHTAMHDDARGGWLSLGHCTEDVQPRGMTAGDYCCDSFKASDSGAPDDGEKNAG